MQKKYRVPLCLGLAIALASIAFQVADYGSDAANRCHSLLILVIILWITNCFPLFITTLFVPVAAVLLNVMRDDMTGMLLDAPDAAHQLISAMMASSVLVILSAFALAICHQRYTASWIQDNAVIRKVSKKPLWLVLLAIAMTWSFSIFLPNISTAAITYSIFSHRLRGQMLPLNVSKALIIGVVMAGDLGGMLTPVSSPQSIMAYELLKDEHKDLTWLTWLKISSPVAFLSTAFAWLLISFVYGLFKAEAFPEKVEVLYEGPEQEPWPVWKIWAVLILTITTLVFWIASAWILPVFGSLGVISLIPFIATFVFELLKPEDLSLLPWDIILLVMGVVSLTEATRSSGLLEAVGLKVTRYLGGYSFWVQATAICFVIILFATFKSRLISASIFVPMLMAFASSFEGPINGLRLSLLASLATSCGLAMPFSGFVNARMVAVADGDGQPILDITDFLKIGIPVSLVAYGLLLSFGYLFFDV